MRTIVIVGLLLSSINLYSQERYITVDKQQYRIKTMGKGNVTVIFESGMSDSLEIWGNLPDSIAKFAKVFLYDRADIGKSDTSRQERTIPNMVNELYSILKASKMEAPYVFVGHSLGGFIGRYFVSQYPNMVKGLLLLDPGPESYWNNMSKRELKKYIKGGTKWYIDKYEPRYRKEWYQLIPNLKYMENLDIPPDLPIILVTASKSNWYQFHSDILNGLNNSKHIELEGTHYIHKEHQQETINYIKELIYK